ncbi:SLC13/DASS family transporter, partial [Salmonella enterica subsp. enterica serovar Weltevreden]|nr:SLC13/DASS family transporter [Salmonella enterica subsp. enterica serovar Weltevreden]
MPFFEYAQIGIPFLIACSRFLYFFGSKLIADRDGHTQSDSHMDYSQIPAWRRFLTFAVLIVAVAGLVGTAG